MKICTKCHEEKDLSMFRVRKSRAKAGGIPIPRSQCKNCESKEQVIRAKTRMESDPEFKNKSLDRIKKWDEQNKERRLKAYAERRKARYKKDPQYRAKVISGAASYRSRKIDAEPSWLSAEDKARTDNIYETAAKISERTKKPHDVDHVVPLQGENVCGLHVWWNLAIIPASMNRSKGNSYPSFNIIP